MHKKLEHLVHLLENSTLGNWGPTTAPPQGEDQAEFHLVKEGKRGEPTWGAVVSDQDGEPGVDHQRYAQDDPNSWYYEPGTDIYGGTLIAESIVNPFNGMLMAEAHNQLPNLIHLINQLEKVAREVLRKEMVDQIIENALGPNE